MNLRLILPRTRRHYAYDLAAVVLEVASLAATIRAVKPVLEQGWEPLSGGTLTFAILLTIVLVIVRVRNLAERGAPESLLFLVIGALAVSLMSGVLRLILGVPEGVVLALIALGGFLLWRLPRPKTVIEFGDAGMPVTADDAIAYAEWRDHSCDDCLAKWDEQLRLHVQARSPRPGA